MTEEVLAPLAGKVLSVAVTVGDAVEEDDEVLVLEAMKMENSLKAERDAIIYKVHAVEGQVLEQDELIIAFEQNTQ